MVPVTTLPVNLLLSIFNKTDNTAYVRLRQTNRHVANFIEFNRAMMKGVLSKFHLQLTNRVIDIYRRKRISMDLWENSEEIRSTLIGFRPNVVTLRKPVGPNVLKFIKYYNLQNSPIFFHDLEVDTLVPILTELSPITIRVSNDKEAYDERLFNLPQIQAAQRVRFDFFLGLHPICHPLLLQNVHELHIGFTNPTPFTVLRELLVNFWNSQTKLGILDLYTFSDVAPSIIIKRLLQNILYQDWLLLPKFGPRQLSKQFPFYSSCDTNTYAVAKIKQKETSKKGLLFVSSDRIMFVVKKN